MKKENVLLGDFLVSQGLINDDQLRQALKYQKEKGKLLGRALIDLNFLGEQDMIKAVGEKLGVQYVSLKTYRIDPLVISLIPEHIARGFQVLPLFRIDTTLTVGMVNPLDIAAIDAITRVTQLKVSPIVCSEIELRDAIEHHYGNAPRVVESDGERPFVRVIGVENDEKESPVIRQDLSETSASLVEPLGRAARQVPEENSAMTKMLETLVLSARRNHANYLHIEATSEGLLIRHRVDGRLLVAGQHPHRLTAPLLSQLKKNAGLLNPAAIEKQRSGEGAAATNGMVYCGRLHIDVDGESIDAGVSIMPSALGESVVLRLASHSGPMRLEDLSLPSPIFEAVKSALSHPHGLFIVAGSAGGGNHPTLYALLRSLQSAERNIVALEEAIDEVIDGCRQVQVSAQDGLSFEDGFHAAMQQDADVIMVSHLRSEEIARQAVSAALDGKFVLLGVPAHDAAAGIIRLLDMGIKPNLLAATVRAVLAQRLVRRICEHCKSAEPATPEIRQMLPRLFDQPTTVYRGRGCSTCQGTGYRGRALLTELLPGNESMQNLLRSASTSGLPASELKKNQIGSLSQDGLEKMLKGITTWEEVVRASAAG